MNRICVALLCGFLGPVGAAVAIPSQVNKQAEAPTEKLVATLRLLNTQEVLYYHEIRRFASHDELLTFLRTKGTLGQSPIDLDSPGPYELAITTSADGLHYFISLKRDSTAARMGGCADRLLSVTTLA
jgi:hypothetical protein